MSIKPAALLEQGEHRPDTRKHQNPPFQGDSTDGQTFTYRRLQTYQLRMCYFLIFVILKQIFISTILIKQKIPEILDEPRRQVSFLSLPLEDPCRG